MLFTTSIKFILNNYYIFGCISSLFAFDVTMDKAVFDLSWLSKETVPLNKQNSEDSIIMKTKNNEKYECFLPTIDDKHAEDDTYVYSGPSELHLLKKLFQSTQCSFRWETYWSYELCHGKHFRQFHESKEPGKKSKLQQYYLGYYEDKLKSIPTANSDSGRTLADIRKNLKKRKLENSDIFLPYFSLNYTSGTACDVTGQPRLTHVLYICHKNARAELIEVKEVSSCEYEAIILTELLCAHPAYTTGPKKSRNINCTPLLNSPIIPKDVVKFESQKHKIFTSNENSDENYDENDSPNEKHVMHPQDNQESIKIDSQTISTTQEKPPRVPLAISSQTIQQMINEFINGDYCLVGGVGWWQHKFCFQRNVIQYHQEKEGKKIIINMGYWNSKSQINWMEKHPTKRPEEHLASRKQVIQYYGNGDRCDETGKERFVEIKLKCIEGSFSKSQISIYLLEPKTCEYILTIESALLCHIMDKVDSNGIIYTDKTVP